MTLPGEPVTSMHARDFEAIRRVFEREGYARESIVERLGLIRPWLSPILKSEVVMLAYRLRGGDPLALLIRTFFLGQMIDRGAFRALVSPTEPDLWERSGMVLCDGDRILPRVRVAPLEGLLVTIDADWHVPWKEDESLRVMAVSGSSLSLAAGMIRRPCVRTLDLGTGGGVLGLLAAGFSREVVGTDLNPYAIRRAEFNARFNGLDHTRWAVGSWFEPVADRQFDRIVTNPPFVVSPESTSMYRDSGRPLDTLGRELVQQIPDHLEPGGFGQIQCNWLRIRGQGPDDRLREWLDGTGCDAWILSFHTVSPEQYARDWLSQALGDRPDELSLRFESWMSYYEREGIEAMTYGQITLRRRAITSGPNWLRVDRFDEPTGDYGEEIWLGFERFDFLASVEADEALLKARLRTGRGLTWAQTLQPGPRGWALTGSRIGFRHGLPFSIDANPSIAAMLTSCQGDRPVGEVLRDHAARIGEDPDTYPASNASSLRGLIEMGYLEPAG